jgi:hypothetical protein
VPSEGYINVLLVLLVAAVIRFGGDPLFAARVISLMAAVGMVFLLYRTAHRELGSDPAVTGILAMGILTFSTTIEVAMLGLETVFFAATMFPSYAFSQRFFETESGLCSASWG